MVNIFIKKKIMRIWLLYSFDILWIFFRNCFDFNSRGFLYCDFRGGVLLSVWISYYIVVYLGVYIECENMLKYVKMWIILLFVLCIKLYWMLMFELL